MSSRKEQAMEKIARLRAAKKYLADLDLHPPGKPPILDEQELTVMSDQHIEQEGRTRCKHIYHIGSFTVCPCDVQTQLEMPAKIVHGEYDSRASQVQIPEVAQYRMRKRAPNHKTKPTVIVKKRPTTFTPD